MTLLRRIPVYAVGLSLTVSVIAVAHAYNWSDLTTLLVGVGAGVFYVGAILVPWLVREQLTSRPRRSVVVKAPAAKAAAIVGDHAVVSLRITVYSDGEHVEISPEDLDFLSVPQTHGPAVISSSSEPQLVG